MSKAPMFYKLLMDVPHLRGAISPNRARRIYVASSWRNEHQPRIVETLRAYGHEVYDFKNPAPGQKGFGWRDCGGQSAEDGPGKGAMTIDSYAEAINTDRAREGFAFDIDALDWADTCVMVLPCGRSAHLEAGYACGQGKHVIWVLSEDRWEPELMYLMGHDFVTDETAVPTEPTIEDDAICECGEPIKPGDFVYLSIDGGYLHADCCGDADSFVDFETGEPPKTTPQPFRYEP